MVPTPSFSTGSDAYPTDSQPPRACRVYHVTHWAAVLGSPVTHSLSPVLHSTAYAALGVECEYRACHCDESMLPSFIAQARMDPDWVGYSLTMPLKTAVLPLLDDVDGLATTIGAVNTVVSRGGQLVGYNTDVDGIDYALNNVTDSIVSPVILGAGGTARAAVGALAKMGLSRVALAARRPDAAQPLVDLGARLDINVDVHPWGILKDVDVVIATTPAGATDGLVDQSWPSERALVELLYNPWPTKLAAHALAAGAAVAGGLVVLAGQAVGQVQLFTGHTIEVEPLRIAGEQALAARS